MSRKKDEAVKVPLISFSWSIRLGDIFTLLGFVGGIVVIGMSLQSDMTKAKADILAGVIRQERLENDMKTSTLRTDALSEKTAGLQTAITFIAPQLQRIEDKLSRVK